MDSTLEHYVPGQDFATLCIALGREDDLHVHAIGKSVHVDIPLYAFQARELVEILTPLAEERDAGDYPIEQDAKQAQNLGL